MQPSLKTLLQEFFQLVTNAVRVFVRDWHFILYCKGSYWGRVTDCMGPAYKENEQQCALHKSALDILGSARF